MSLEQRLDKLERRQRYLVTAALVLGTLAGVLGPSRPDEPGEVKAKRFVVVDSKGAERAALGIEDGAPSLVLYNSAGRGVVRCEVPAVPDKPALYLVDPEQGTLELALTMNGPVVHLSDKTGPRVRLATNELNAPLVAVYDEKAKVLFQVSAGP
ncbi:MAG: hypothetical protein WD847_11805 [Pirellulales bacterium]